MSNIDALPVNTNVTSEEANNLLQLQRNILEKVALGHEQEYQLILEELCKASEALIPDAVASIMVFNDSKSSLQVVAAPSLPEPAKQALNGLVPGDYAGSCGTAVYSNKPQFVYNTRSDLRWADFQQFIIDFSVGACWSIPIRINTQGPIGSFALSSFEERKPSAFYINLLEISASIAGVIIKRQQEQKQLWKMAHYDPLTNLPNRTLLNLQLQKALEKSQQNKQKIALLFLDLNNFKVINDTQGHDVGDKVLIAVAKQIKNCLRPNDTLARLGGDEFVIVVDHFKNNDDLNFICEKILSSVKQCNESINYTITTSIGVCISPNHGDTINILMRNADAAMYEAKSRGLSKYHIYQQKLTPKAQDKLKLSKEMETALEQKQFLVHYQPQFDYQAKNIVGVEALVRWQHDVQGLVSPVDFIPMAEENGMINEIGFMVLKTACQQCLQWWHNGLAKFILAVNVSVKQLQSGFASQILSLLQDLNFPLSQLELEITESSIIQSVHLTELNKLNAMGINIAMDDFGTGHSSLTQLKSLPINKLKIDRSFVKNIPHNKDDVKMASTIIAMGHSLELKIVAEGIETEQQLHFLSSKGCDLLQGYLLCIPLSAEQFTDFIKQQIQ